MTSLRLASGLEEQAEAKNRQKHNKKIEAIRFIDKTSNTEFQKGKATIETYQDAIDSKVSTQMEQARSVK